ncbi:MAG: glutaredoxin family protein [Acidobacteria bacterium]|nr:glutaredoxin family protein [Acidobacteriota bacterium]
MVTVRFYTRHGCHLCETAETVLRAERQQKAFHLAVFDIDADPELRDLYNVLVPVTVLPDGEEMHYRVDVERLRRALATS